MTNDVLATTNLLKSATNALNEVPGVAGNLPSPSQPVLWMLITGCVFGGLTLLFLMYLAIEKEPVEDRRERDKRFLIVSIISFGLALTAGFLGSSGALSGDIPIPNASHSRLTMGVTGGAAIFLISWVIGYWLYVRVAPLPRPELCIDYPAGTSLAEAIKLAAQKNLTGACSVEFLPDEQSFRDPMVAAGQLCAKDAVGLVNLLQKHLAQGAIKYTATKPENQDRITVRKEN